MKQAETEGKIVGIGRRRPGAVLWMWGLWGKWRRVKGSVLENGDGCGGGVRRDYDAYHVMRKRRAGLICARRGLYA